MSADKCERCGEIYRGEHICADITPLEKIADTLGEIKDIIVEWREAQKGGAR